jgi:hypothetical protein
MPKPEGISSLHEYMEAAARRRQRLDLAVVTNTILPPFLLPPPRAATAESSDARFGAFTSNPALSSERLSLSLSMGTGVVDRWSRLDDKVTAAERLVYLRGVSTRHNVRLYLVGPPNAEQLGGLAVCSYFESMNEGGSSGTWIEDPESGDFTAHADDQPPVIAAAKTLPHFGTETSGVLSRAASAMMAGTWPALREELASEVGW